MTSIHEAIRSLFMPAPALQMGVYHYQSPPNDLHNYRLHLRLEEDGSGILILNASTILHLNQTASEYAYHLIKQTNKTEISRLISRRYKVKPAKVLQDFEDFSAKIDSLIQSPDLDPEIYLGMDRTAATQSNLSAPLRLDCALTYSLRPDCDPAFSPHDRVKRELNTLEWIQILEKAWQAGIPHIIFTGGEPTLRPDLIDFIRKAESLGQVTGLMTDGLGFLDPNYTNQILQTGLDHIVFLLQPDKETSWDALSFLVKQDIFVAAHLTLTPTNNTEVTNALLRLAQLGITTISLSASHRNLDNELQTLRIRAADLNLTNVWDLPVPYSPLNPVALELDQPAQQRKSSRSWLYIEPDGDVLDSQGMTEVRGNFQTDSWEKIWRN